ncbi:hypothetical protein ACR2VJ_27600 [Klebsiella pneumoniae]
MQPIETHYKGYRFRSRLEARWAVFFDHLGLSWEYEPEGFDLGDGVWYLPDFKVCGAVWVEVKPEAVHADEKFSKFKDCEEIEFAALVCGDPKSVIDSFRSSNNVKAHPAFVLMVFCDYNMMTEGRKALGDSAARMERWGYGQTLINSAARAARQARFEHGENNG